MWRVALDNLMQGADLAIDTEKLNLWYGTFQALYNIDLQIKQGMITSLIGPSGCGKTTLSTKCQPHRRASGLRQDDRQYQGPGP